MFLCGTRSRLRWHQPTKDYVARRTTEDLSKKEIIRCLKRYVAREVFHVLVAQTALANAARQTIEASLWRPFTHASRSMGP